MQSGSPRAENRLFNLSFDGEVDSSSGCVCELTCELVNEWLNDLNCQMALMLLVSLRSVLAEKGRQSMHSMEDSPSPSPSSISVLLRV